jgi:hypothetical protein
MMADRSPETMLRSPRQARAQRNPWRGAAQTAWTHEGPTLAWWLQLPARADVSCPIATARHGPRITNGLLDDRRRTGVPTISSRRSIVADCNGHFIPKRRTEGRRAPQWASADPAPAPTVEDIERFPYLEGFHSATLVSGCNASTVERSKEDDFSLLQTPPNSPSASDRSLPYPRHACHRRNPAFADGGDETPRRAPCPVLIVHPSGRAAVA